MLKVLLCRNAFAISTTTSRISHLPPFFQFSLIKFLNTSTSHSFVVSYLINKFRFSPQFALKASKYLRFKTSQNPDSVLNFFKNHGFTDSDIHSIIKREPWLLSCDTHKRILPKFQFLLSKGASSSDIVRIVVGCPRFMGSSLKNCVIPTYEFIAQFMKSDQNVVASLISCSSLLSSRSVAANVKLLVDHGVGKSNIFRIINARANVLCTKPHEFEKTLNVLKDMGFDPTKIYFGDAFLAMRCISKSKWNAKIDTFKKWGWSEETVLEAIRKQPKCMLVSNEKINRVMEFWINQLGWDDRYLVKGPGILAYSLEKRVIPRASVVHYLLSKGLISKTASLHSPFFMSEKLFLEKYVKCFQEEETSRLLKLYREKMNLEVKMHCATL